MAMLSVFFSLLFILFFSYQPLIKLCVSGGKLVQDTQFQHVHSLDSLLPMPTCQSTTRPGIGRKYGAALIPSRGPCSPFPWGRDLSRGHSIGKSLAGTNPQKKPTRGGRGGSQVPIMRDGYQYLVQVRIGNPPHPLTLIMDTGSGITWTQCIPCPHDVLCQYYNQTNPFFKTTGSSTFSFKPNLHPYNIKYFDGSQSRGPMAQDTLIIGSPQAYHIPNFTFGCGQYSEGYFGTADGIFGLGAEGENAFLSQTSSTLGQTLCFCIPPTSSSIGHLFLGDDARTNCQTEGSSSTLLINDKKYIVNLYGITVGSQTINIANLDPSYPNQTLIDSGTAITRLPRLVYQKLRSAFREYMSKYPVIASSHDDDIMDTCYNLKDYTTVALPKIVLHFDRANVTLDPAGVVSLESKSRICLAFAENKFPDHEFNIMGSVQMRKLNVLFDVNARKVRFGRGSCG
ncbi:aspartyl protease family protein At5g10770-like [Punica granatum]|uniref:Peptidase A1 domain-containing protein n=2 Tax=Punica granatum TaxID=22663 RepID=A0A218WTW9_PUNGR|nr:aspartyl protease family protein At5g10770-like [Punica granatum]OWM75820.1 hypothetical protein CDL15_Pgr009464 [Punica granatum]PKI55934.1 hypothetical protein CRG98_023666 [Punica granatum]